jgi:hypothetical protein
MVAENNHHALTLQATHSSAYAAVVQPGRAFYVSRYFLERWMPLMGPNAAWLVICLRQLAYWNDRQDWWRGSYDQLTTYMGLARATIAKALRGAFVDFFVEREAAAAAQEANRYRVRMEDPLTPADAQHLHRLLVQYREDHPTMPAVDQALSALQACLATERRKLLAPCPMEANDEKRPRTVSELVSEVFCQEVHISAVEQQLLTEQCQALYQHLVAPTHAVRVSHYLRQGWAGVLKPLGLWLLLYLRSKCFWNLETGELRDRSTIPDLAELATLWGRNVRTLERTLQRLQEQGFVSHLQRRRRGAGRQKRLEVRFQVCMWDPVAAGDRSHYEKLLEQEAKTAGMTRRPVQAEAEEQTATKLNYETERSVTKLNYNATNLNYETAQTVTKLNYDATNLNHGAGQTVTKLNGLQDSIEDSFQDLTTREDQQQQKTSVRAEEDTAAPAVALPDLLDSLQIVGTARRELLSAGVSAENALAWTLYGLREPGLAGRLAGWLVNRLRDPHDRTHPPQPFADFARLRRAQWTTLAMAAHERRMSGRWSVPEVLEKVAEVWWELYGAEEAENLPLGLGDEAAQKLRQEVETWEEALSPPGPADQAGDEPLGPAQERWAEILDVLRILTTPAVYQRFLAPSRAISLDKGNGTPGRLVVGVNSYEAQERLNYQLGRVVQRAVQAMGAAPLEVTFVARNGDIQEREAVNDRRV